MFVTVIFPWYFTFDTRCSWSNQVKWMRTFLHDIGMRMSWSWVIIIHVQVAHMASHLQCIRTWKSAYHFIISAHLQHHSLRLQHWQKPLMLHCRPVHAVIEFSSSCNTCISLLWSSWSGSGFDPFSWWTGSAHTSLTWLQLKCRNELNKMKRTQYILLDSWDVWLYYMSSTL